MCIHYDTIYDNIRASVVGFLLFFHWIDFYFLHRCAEMLKTISCTLEQTFF